MSVKISAEYINNSRVKLNHCLSGDKIITDLPVDNGGKGGAFSPTDLFASALASCVLTIMSKVADKNGINFEGARMEMEKVMAENPRRVAKLTGIINLPSGLNEADRNRLVACIKACPVHKSLHPDIEVDFKIA